MHVQVQQSSMLGTLIPVLVVLLVVALRWRGVRRARRLRLETLWVLPAIYAAVVAVFLAARPPAAAVWGWAAVALIAGAAAGWQRGRMMRIAVDPDSHELSQQASPVAFALLVGLLLVRQFARVELGQGHAALVATDIGMAFGLGLVVAMRVEMALRARRLLGEARGTARA